MNLVWVLPRAGSASYRRWPTSAWMKRSFRACWRGIRMNFQEDSASAWAQGGIAAVLGVIMAGVYLFGAASQYTIGSLIDRHGFSLVATGNAALVLSVLGMVAPPLFGRFDPGDARRRRWLFNYTLGCAGLFGLLALSLGATSDVALSLAIGLVSGYMVMQYADVRMAYPEIGRAHV